MKTITTNIALICAMFMVSQAFAQNIYVHAGGGFANMLVQDDEDVFSEDYEAKPGITFGIVAERALSPMLSAGGGVLYVPKGYRFSETIFDIDVEQNFNINYLQIPLFARIGTQVSGFRLFGDAGIFASYAINGNAETTFEADGETESETEEIDWDEDPFNRMGFGLIVGAGVEMRGIQLTINYQHGLANFIDTDHENITEDSAYMGHRVIAFTIGYKLNQLFGGI